MQSKPAQTISRTPPQRAPAMEPTEQPAKSVSPWVWQGKVMPAFWSIGSFLSILLNLILLIVVIILGRELFALKTLINDGLIGGLYQNFVKMDEASITTNIQVQDTIVVQDTIPVVFDLPLKQSTVVNLVEDVSIPNTAVYLNGVPIYTTVVLPQGTPLNITLDLIVPVSQTLPIVLNVPVLLNVPVNIPLEQTELHEPFVGLQNVVAPYKTALDDLPNSWNETPLCGPFTGWLCGWLLDAK